VSEVRRFASDAPWEDGFGYSRAVVAGPFVFLSGCTSILDGAIRYEGDPYQQAKTALEVAERALVQAGAAITDVVQSRIYIVHARDAEAVGLAHSEVFDAIRPASTLLVVEGLIDPRLLVEIELLAYLGSGSGG